MFPPGWFAFQVFGKIGEDGIVPKDTLIVINNGMVRIFYKYQFCCLYPGVSGLYKIGYFAPVGTLTVFGPVNQQNRYFHFVGIEKWTLIHVNVSAVPGISMC